MVKRRFCVQCRRAVLWQSLELFGAAACRGEVRNGRGAAIARVWPMQGVRDDAKVLTS